MGEVDHQRRQDALRQVWARWAKLGREFCEREWTAPSRCPGWDVAALFAHVGMFPAALLDPPRPEGEPAEVVTAAQILRGFNAPGGVAEEMAAAVRDGAVEQAARRGRQGLVACYEQKAERGLAAVGGRSGAELVAWPGARAVTTWEEGLRIVLLESAVHLLDVFDALGREPAVPEPGLREASRLLVELADPVRFSEAATGRGGSPLPLLR